MNMNKTTKWSFLFSLSTAGAQFPQICQVIQYPYQVKQHFFFLPVGKPLKCVKTFSFKRHFALVFKYGSFRRLKTFEVCIHPPMSIGFRTKNITPNLSVLAWKARRIKRSAYEKKKFRQSQYHVILTLGVIWRHAMPFYRFCEGNFMVYPFNWTILALLSHSITCLSVI